MSEAVSEQSHEAKLREQADRGANAEMVLRELDAAFKQLEERIFSTFRESDVHDANGQKMCRLYLKVLDDVISRFKQFVRTGEDAGKELVRLKDPSRLRRFLNVR